MERLVPELRFPEFAEEWRENTLLELSENGFSNGIFNDPKKVGKGYKLINVKDMYVGDSIDINTLTLVDIDDKEFVKNKVEYGDIFFTRSSIVKEGIAHSNVNLSNAQDLTYDGHLIRMRPDKRFYLPLFLANNFKTHRVRNQLVMRGKTSTMTTIGQDDIASVKIAFPSLPEQTKIAEFLTAIDKRIELLTAKKEKLTLYKKGVMQKIFNQEMRFKQDDGGEFPEWEEKALGDIGETINGLTGKSAKDFGSGRRYVQYKQIFDQPVLDITKCGYVEINEGEKQNTLQYGDILFTVSSETPNEIGMSSVYLSQDTDIYLNSFCFGLRIKKSANLIPLFSVHLFRDQKFRNSIIQLAQGSTRFNMSKKQFLLLKILLPSQKEQVVISNFLNRLDNQIHNIGRQIILNQNYKKGLLQQMFV
jgi:type I restriction enzyme S subunit